MHSWCVFKKCTCNVLTVNVRPPLISLRKICIVGSYSVCALNRCRLHILFDFTNKYLVL